MMTILLIEDSEDLRSILANQFKIAGVEVFEAENGKAGLKVLAEQQIDLVLTDVQMPPMTGMEFLKIAKASKISLPPIVVMTAGSPYSPQQFFDEGAAGYIEKSALSIEHILRFARKVA